MGRWLGALGGWVRNMHEMALLKDIRLVASSYRMVDWMIGWEAFEL